MAHTYQLQDLTICDYELFALPGVNELLRGPRLNNFTRSGNFVSFIGAAQTFGALCRYPFPNLLGSMLGVEVLNLGFGGAGPGKFLQSPTMIEYVNRSRCCVVQVMSGRSAANSAIANPAGGSMVRWVTDAPDVSLRNAEELYQELIDRMSPTELSRIVEETRDSWVAEYATLTELITVPKILFWFARRDPDYQIDYGSVRGLFGGFPQLVDGATLDRIRQHFDVFVSSVCGVGMPAPLLNRFTGTRGFVKRGQHWWKSNGYYPSQEMHLQAALALRPAIEEILA